MLKKKPIKKSDKTSVIFEVCGRDAAKQVALVGEFNEWQLESNPMKLRKDGTWSTTVRLPKNASYQFRYVVDGTEWIADEDADDLVLNPFGGQNSIVDLH
jgi:1,4-alpha-glucan branching enzyme